MSKHRPLKPGETVVLVMMGHAATSTTNLRCFAAVATALAELRALNAKHALSVFTKIAKPE